jgi:hypothetical protein
VPFPPDFNDFEAIWFIFHLSLFSDRPIQFFFCTRKMKSKIGLIFSIVIVLVLVIYMVAMTSESFMSEGGPQPSPRYATLENQYMAPLFAPCLAKRCAGGPYMFSSNPKLAQACQNISNFDMAQVACGKGFIGRPVHFEYTPLSDDKWTNAQCRDGSSANGSLCVL